MNSLLLSINNLIMSVCTVDDYDLLVIEDEETPLAAGINGPDYFLIAMITVLSLIALMSFALWCVKRNNSKARLLELRERMGNQSTFVPLSIRLIEDEIAECEAEISSTYI